MHYFTHLTKPFLHHGTCVCANYTDLHCKPNTEWFSFCSASCIWRQSSAPHQINSPTQNDNTGSEIAPMHAPRHASVRPTTEWKCFFPFYPCNMSYKFPKILYPGGASEIILISRPTSLRSRQGEWTAFLNQQNKWVIVGASKQVNMLSFVQVIWSHRPTPQGTGHVSTYEVGLASSPSSVHHGGDFKFCRHGHLQLQLPRWNMPTTIFCATSMQDINKRMMCSVLT